MNARLSTLVAIACTVFAGCGSNSTPSAIGPNPTPTPVPTATPTVPATATSQTWRVTAGSSASNGALQALAFYPASITIDAGDTVTWLAPPAEPHTISVPVPGQSPPPVTDPSAQMVVGGSTYDATAYVSSGFIGGGAKYSLTFTKPGTYTYYSLPQGFVNGTVVVQAAGAPYPTTQSAYDAAAQSAISSDIAIAQTSISTIPFAMGSTTIAAGVSPGGPAPSNGTVMRFLNGPTLADAQSTTFPVGTTLTFKNLSNDVPHTVTFPAVGGMTPPGPPGQPAVGGNTYDGTSLVNSGAIPPGGTFTLTFTKAGTYPYHCLFHDDDEGMIASVTIK